MEEYKLWGFPLISFEVNISNTSSFISSSSTSGIISYLLIFEFFLLCSRPWNISLYKSSSKGGNDMLTYLELDIFFWFYSILISNDSTSIFSLSDSSSLESSYSEALWYSIFSFSNAYIFKYSIDSLCSSL